MKQEEESMYNGIIHLYLELKGFGFIINKNDVKQRIFFHIKNWQSCELPQIGQAVQFDIGPGSPGKGEQAIDVRPVAAVAVVPASVTIGGRNE
jgi:cold shock CspA family protein